jgi:hypothetical protein
VSGESTWSAAEPFEHVDRFTWERLILDPKVGMPRETLLVALLLATWSTGKTGGDIKVSQETLRDVLGYDDSRHVRRLLAELRDDLGIIERVHRGNQHKPTEHALVIPNDLLERAEALRSGREAESARKAVYRTPSVRSNAKRPAGSAGVPDAGTKSTGRRDTGAADARRPTTKKTKQLDQDENGRPYAAEVEVAPAREADEQPDFEDERRAAHDELAAWIAKHPESAPP